MKNIYVILFLIIAFQSYAQKSNRVMGDNVFSAMDATQQAEIDENMIKARDQFLKVLSKEPNDPMANFGLSVVYGFDKFTNKDYFAAWKYFKTADLNQATFNEEDKVVLNEYFFKQDKRRRNRPLEKNMEWEKGLIEDKLIKFVREENQITYAEKYLADFPDSRYTENVTHIRNYIEYRIAENTNTVQALNQFIEKYPQAAQVDQAKQLRDKLAYNDAVAKNSLSALKAFVVQYPGAVQVEECKKLMGVMAYEEAAKSKNLEQIEQFMREYPNSSKMPEAKTLKRQLLFDWAKSVNTIAAYNKFVALYPEGELYIDIFNLKANALGQQVLMDLPMENYKLVKGFDNQGLNDYGGDILMRPNGNILLISNTKRSATDMYDVWFIELNKEGTMVTNNIMGNEYDDQINNALITLNNELYATGATNAIKDSVLGTGWIFKLNAQGSNVYNRKLNTGEVSSMALFTDGKALVGSYQINPADSSILPFFAKISQTGKDLWTRSYSQKGNIYGVAINNQNLAFVASETWYFAVDESGYIKWDKMVEADTKITAVSVSHEGNIVFAGLRGGNGYAVCCNASGANIWETTFDAKNMTHVKEITVLSDNSVICSGTSTDNKVVLVKINQAGQVQPSKVFSVPGGLWLNGIAADTENSAIISVTKLSPQQDIIVFKMVF